MTRELSVQSAQHGTLTLRVDEEDVHLLDGQSIYLDGKGYPSIWRDGKNVRVHRYLAGDPPGLVDHRNRDVFDATRGNLRVCTKSQNGFNRGASKRSPTGYKGVCRTKEGTSWRVVISVEGKQTSAQGFRTPEEAARAYDKLARALHGEFAYLNFPHLESEP